MLIMRATVTTVLLIASLFHAVFARSVHARDWNLTESGTNDTKWTGVTQQITADAIDSLNTGYYNESDGRWDSIDAWWLTGLALQAVLDYTKATGDTQYLAKAKNTVELQKGPLPWWPQGGGIFRADSTDDTGWWALALVRLFDLTGDEEYLGYATTDEEYMYSYWTTSDCGGGIWWSVSPLGYKNAISNALYIKLAASLHNRSPGDTLYLGRALQAWEWFNASGVINSANLVNDGVRETAAGDPALCYNDGETVWTYNQGTIIGALTELYRATGDEDYLQTAKKIADAVISNSSLSQGGVLTESCEAPGNCDDNMVAYKGVFAKGLAELDALLPEASYRDYLDKNAESAWTLARNSSDFYGTTWHGPYDRTLVGSQTSAIFLLVANLET